MKVLLTGADGFLGSNITVALIAAGHAVQPASRRHGVDFCRMLTPEDWRPHLYGVDAVINCVGIISESKKQTFEQLHYRAPAALFRACAKYGVKRVVQISALGAENAGAPLFLRTKAAADQVLRELNLEGFVLRPSLVYGTGGASFQFFKRLAGLPLIPVIGDGNQRVQPVHVSDVVATVMQSLMSNASGLTLDVVGATEMMFVEWLQLIRHMQLLPPARLVHLPLPVVMAVAQMAQYFTPMIQPDNLRMLQSGCIADAQPLERFLGRKPLAPEQELFISNVMAMGDHA